MLPGHDTASASRISGLPSNAAVSCRPNKPSAPGTAQSGFRLDSVAACKKKWLTGQPFYKIYSGRLLDSRTE